jgi:hypothetical protein
MHPWLRAFPEMSYVEAMDSPNLFSMTKKSAPFFAPGVPTFVATIFVILVLWPELARSRELSDRGGLDFSLSTPLRSYPLSGVLTADLGFGQQLWGQQSPWYGYARLGTRVHSAVTYNAVEGVVDVFPVSFLGVRGGHEWIDNQKDYPSYECTATQKCQGQFARRYIEAELTLGAGALFGQFRARRERWTQNGSRAGVDDPTWFVEPSAGLLVNRVGGSQSVGLVSLGWRWSESWATLALYRHVENDEQQSSSFPVLAQQWRQGPWSAVVGGGWFASELKSEGLSVVLALRWSPRPGLSLQ